ncbi:MAG TPA: Rnase Y domain-containing protein, partial [Candidatus Binataceae bacterium]|nr:Rnase Y domain-containing protein [Candidatus Binataceae bacterium]
MEFITAILGFIVGGALFLVWGLTQRRKDAVNVEAARTEATDTVKEAQSKSDLIVKEAEVKAKDLLVEARATAEREMRDRRREIQSIESKLETREETFQKRQEGFERREADLNRRDQSIRSREKNITDKEEQQEKTLQEQRAKVDALVDEARGKLEAVAGLTREEAKRTLLDEMVGQARTDAARQIRIIEEEAREEADRRAKRIVSIAIERLAGEFVAERTVSVIALPTDEMKGRIIGREGRNIRA